jgi:hypothetical protein
MAPLPGPSAGSPSAASRPAPRTAALRGAAADALQRAAGRRRRDELLQHGGVVGDAPEEVYDRVLPRLCRLEARLQLAHARVRGLAFRGGGGRRSVRPRGREGPGAARARPGRRLLALGAGMRPATRPATMGPPFSPPQGTQTHASTSAPRQHTHAHTLSLSLSLLSLSLSQRHTTHHTPHARACCACLSRISSSISTFLSRFSESISSPRPP